MNCVFCRIIKGDIPSYKIYEDEKLFSPYYGKKQDIVYFKYNQKIYSIESKILRRCVKASRYIGEIDNTYIIFPYQPEPLSEEELKKQFPKAYNYLRKNKEKLEKRDLRNTDWFLFGRSQGIKNSNQKKIIFKHIISRETPVVIPYILDEDIVVYGGIFTTSNDLKRVKNIFSSSEFAKYCSLVGKDKSGGFVEISKISEKIFSISTGAIVGKPRDTILARTASFESQFLTISSDLFDLTSNAESDLKSSSVSFSISDFAYSSATESRIYPAKNWSFL